jgi:hypothetical protein
VIARYAELSNCVDWTMRLFLDAQYCPRWTKVVLKRTWVAGLSRENSLESDFVQGTGFRKRRTEKFAKVIAVRIVRSLGSVTDPVEQLERSEAMEL